LASGGISWPILSLPMSLSSSSPRFLAPTG